MQKLILPINQSMLTASWKTAAYRQQFGFEHYGADFISGIGQRLVYSPGKGKVLLSGLDNVLGNVLVLLYDDAFNHITGEARGVICRLYHLDSRRVIAGQKVTKDTSLGNYGNTGKYSTGSHLHIEIDSDLAYPYYTPTLSGRSTYFYGTGSGATDKTMSDPIQWLHCKQNAPDYQTYSAYNDAFIRPENKTIPIITAV